MPNSQRGEGIKAGALAGAGAVATATFLALWTRIRRKKGSKEGHQGDNTARQAADEQLAPWGPADTHLPNGSAAEPVEHQPLFKALLRDVQQQSSRAA